MSATNRKKHDADGNPQDAQHARHPDDDYATPAWCTRVILRRLADTGVLPPFPRRARLDVLEPFAGAGAVVDVLGRELPASDVRSIELDPARAKQCARLARRRGNMSTHRGDTFLLAEGWARGEAAWAGDWWPQLIVTNPPYSRAQEAVDVCRQLVLPRQGHVAMLLRLNFLGSQERAEWLRDNLPAINVLPRRPSFQKVERFHLVYRRGSSVPLPREKQGSPVRDDKGKAIVLPTMNEALDRINAFRGADRELARVKRVVTSTDSAEYAWFVWGHRCTSYVWILDLERAEEEEASADAGE